MKTIYIATAFLLFTLFANADSSKNSILSAKSVQFEVELDSSIRDQAVLIVYLNSLYNLSVGVAEQNKVEAKSHSGNTYYFDLGAQEKSSYFSLQLKNATPYSTPVLDQYFFEPGDKVKIKVKPIPGLLNFDVSFEGVGAMKYTCFNDFRKANSFGVDRSLNAITSDYRYNKDNRELKSLEVRLKIIEKYKSGMSDYAAQLLKADLVGAYGNQLADSFDVILRNRLIKKDTIGFKQLAADWNVFKFDYVQDIPMDILVASKNYSYYLLKSAENNVYSNSGKRDYTALYELLKKTDNQQLRDKLIAVFFINFMHKVNVGYNDIIEDALKTVKTPEFKSKVEQFDRGHVGNKAYNFSLTDAKGEKVFLSDFKGKIVFIDFWFTGCTACKKYYQFVLKDVEKIYNSNKDIVFMTICIDKDKEKWLNSVNSDIYTSADIVNLYTEGKAAQHPLIKYYNISAYPHPMLIGRKGEIIKFTGHELRKKETLIAEIDKALQAPSK